MALRIRGKRISEEYAEIGVRFADGYELWCSDEDDARAMRAMTGGTLITRQVYVSESELWPGEAADEG